MTLTVAELLENLGFDAPGADLDEAIRWALVELSLRREREKARARLWDQLLERVSDQELRLR